MIWMLSSFRVASVLVALLYCTVSCIVLNVWRVSSTVVSYDVQTSLNVVGGACCSSVRVGISVF